MATSRKRKRNPKDTSRTFLVPQDVVHSFSVGPVAIVDKVSADYRRTLPQTHNIRPPTPPLDFFFDDPQLGGEEGSYEILLDSSARPVTVDFTNDSITEHRKRYVSSVSQLTFQLQIFHLIYN
jgi:hypothetical protein